MGTVHKLVLPKLVGRILDELDERDQQAPRMRPIHDQPLEQHSGYLLLDGLGVGLGEQIEQGAAEVVRVAVGIAQLIGDRVEKQIAALRVEVDGEILKDVHVRRVGDRRHVGRVALAAYEGYGLGADVQDEGVHQLDVVAHAGLLGYLRGRTGFSIEHFSLPEEFYYIRI